MNALSLKPLSFTLRAPLATAHGVLRERTGWALRFEAEGVTGYGEALPHPAFGTETHEACAEALGRALSVEAPGSPEEVERALEGLDATPSARFGVETALLDWLGKRRGVSVAALLGGASRAVVKVNALLSAVAPTALASEARAARAAGFETVKLKVAGRAVDEDVARVFAVREAVGSAVRIRVDANGGWSAGQALEALERLAPASLELCEQPTPADDWEALARVRAAKRCPIAADEALLVPGGAERLLTLRACDVLVLKPMALGGLRRALALARRAQAQGMEAYVTGLIDGEVARAAAAQAASLLPTDRAHGLATGALFAEPDCTGWLAPRGGALHLPGTPGLGVEGAR